MIRRPPRSTQSRSSAASDVYKRQLREHEGTVEEIEAIYNPSTGTLTFNTGAYSTYVLAYNDPVNPPTYDNILNGIALGLSSILGLCGMKIYTKKRRK